MTRYAFLWRPMVVLDGPPLAMAVVMIDAESVEEAKKKFIKLIGSPGKLKTEVYVCEVIERWTG